MQKRWESRLVQASQQQRRALAPQPPELEPPELEPPELEPREQPAPEPQPALVPVQRLGRARLTLD